MAIASGIWIKKPLPIKVLPIVPHISFLTAASHFVPFSTRLPPHVWAAHHTHHSHRLLVYSTSSLPCLVATRPKESPPIFSPSPVSPRLSTPCHRPQTCRTSHCIPICPTANWPVSRRCVCLSIRLDNHNLTSFQLQNALKKTASSAQSPPASQGYPSRQVRSSTPLLSDLAADPVLSARARIAL